MIKIYYGQQVLSIFKINQLDQGYISNQNI